MRRGIPWLAVTVLGVALALRVLVAFAWTDYAPLSDALHFDRLATSLANGEGWGGAAFPASTGATAFRAPGYPTLLAVVYAIFGDHSWLVARLVNAVLGTCIVALIGVLGTQLFSRRVALTAMGIAAVHPLLILIGAPIALEPLLVVLSLAAVATVLQHRQSPRRLFWPIAAGALLGLAVLTREVAGLLLPPLAVLAFQTSARSWSGEPPWSRRVLVAPIALSLAASVVVLPWTIRNAVALDAFVPVSTSAGVGLAGTFNESARLGEDNGRWMLPWDDPEMLAIILERDWTEPALSDALTNASLDVVRDHPTYLLEVGFWNTVRMFDLTGGGYSRFLARFVPYPDRLLTPSIIAGWVIGLLALAGAFTRRARDAPGAVWAIPAILAPFMVFVLPGSIRYRASLEPFFVLLASAAIVAMIDRVRPAANRVET